jgi:hypothetical protein
MLRRLRYHRDMPVATSPESERLAEALTKRFGDEPITARALAAELVADESPTDLIGAFDDALSRAAAAGETEELDESLWGPAPTDRELAGARQVAHDVLDESMRAALAGALTREQAARRLGISPQAVSKRLAARSVVALSRGRAKRLPAWQFHEDGVLPGLAEVIAAYPGSALSLTTWATSPSPDLDGATPAQALARRDGVQEVLDAVRALTAAAW